MNIIREVTDVIGFGILIVIAGIGIYILWGTIKWLWEDDKDEQ